MRNSFETQHREYHRANQAPLDDGINTGLRLIEGGVEKASFEATRQLGVICVKQTLFGEGDYTERERRVERVTLPSGKTLTAIISEPHPGAVNEPENIETTVLVRGFGELPSAANSSASRLHHEHALRRPGIRTVSFDRYRYSAHDEAVWPWKALIAGLERDEDSAADLLVLSAHYAGSSPVNLMGTSAGFQKVVEMAVQNGKADEKDKLNIQEEIMGIVPCLVAKNVPGAVQFRPEDESEMDIRIRTTTQFLVHVPLDLAESTLKNPLDTINCAGIVGALVMKPWLLSVLPTQFIRHMAGTDFELLTDVTKNHKLKIVAAENDPLLAEKQYEAVEKINPGTVEHIIIPGVGHLSLPLKVEKALDALGIMDVTPRQAPGIMEAGLNLAKSTVNTLGKIATIPLHPVKGILPRSIRRMAA